MVSALETADVLFEVLEMEKVLGQCFLGDQVR